MAIVRVRPPGKDKYGDPLPGSEQRLTIDGAFVAPRTSEDVDSRGRAGVVVGLTLFTPVGTDIVHSDQVEVDGELYSIEGDVGDWTHQLTGWEAGMTVALQRAAG